jgi:hypothetical protein
MVDNMRKLTLTLMLAVRERLPTVVRIVFLKDSSSSFCKYCLKEVKQKVFMRKEIYFLNFSFELE